VCTKFLVGLVTAGFVLSPFAYAADRPQKKDRVDDDMAQAIAFERQKDAAAARQARIEAKHPTVTYSNTEADRDTSKADKSGEDQSKQEKRK
jgi:hypothetical protein